MLNLAALFITLTALCMWFNQRVLRLPPTIGVMAIALAMSLMVIALDHVTVTTVFAQTAEAWLARIDFNVLLMDGMLSLLLFAGALHVDLSKLHHYRVSIGLLATLGVLVSTVVIGTAAWWLFQQVGMGVPYAFCLVFGALISPTDPIAVLGIMRNAGAPVDMEIRIVGESLFNDGVAVVVFTALLGVATASGSEGIDIGHLGLLFIEEAGGGILLGLALGGLVYRLMNSINQYQVEVMLSLALVVGGYALAQALHLSGPIAMVVAGLIIGNMARSGAMSESTRRYLDAFWELIDEILNAVLFVLIGLELVLMPLSIEVVGIALALVVVILVSRFLIIGVPLRLLSSRHDFRAGTTRVLTWGGLRGGISVALALSLPDGEIRNTLVVTTYVIVLFSILVQGLTIGRLVRHVLKAPR
ncbi:MULTISPECIES: cation:proton antiporter [Halomonadaceae]|uniref:cation:proton antiporter n=1 Tax=Halomonadaceae TaxID=28256 RepID=UPI001582F4CE|nr:MULTISPECIES: sodium:proton antiporter [Halomonas]MDI4638760.1 sodium:proton antiporter [Halomonas sp. BMC7]NUJ59745.1 sodium:proton antiporter [Halomonas taeanensis]